MATDASMALKRSVKASEQYLGNALAMLAQDEPGKASELLWGSVAQAVQALATSRNFHLKNHRSLRWFVSQIAKETNDPSVNSGFWIAEDLHRNFHDVDYSTEDVTLRIETIQSTVNKLLDLIPRELVEGSTSPEST